MTGAALEYGNAAVRYSVSLSTEKHAVDIVELPDGSIRAHVDGRPVDVDVAAVGTQLSVRVGGHVVDLTTEGNLPELRVVASGSRLVARVESERTASAERSRKADAGRGENVVRSPMPGRVVKVLVAKGEPVQAGQGLVVLEAMKMENEVRARAAGTVVDVHVLAGAAVEANARLVTLA
ncbi:MAG: biotin/lipoyl-containing protein [Polyangiaceae bacterium]